MRVVFMWSMRAGGGWFRSTGCCCFGRENNGVENGA